MAKFKVETDGGTFIVETEDAPMQADKTSKSKLYGAMALGSELIKGRLGAEVKNTGEEAKQVALGFVEGATAGIPRGIIEATTGKDLKGYRGNVAGQIVGNVVVPGSLALKATKAIKGAGLASVLGRGALAGTIEGALLPNEDSLNVPDRASQALTGAMAGAAGSVILDRGIKTFQGIKKYREANKALKELDDEIFKLKDPNGADSQRVAQIQNEKKTIKGWLKENLATDKERSVTKLKSLASDLDDSAQQASVEVKSKIARKMGDFKRDWGDRFDAVLESSKSTTKASSVIEDIDKTYSELDSMGIDLSGKPVGALEQLRSRMEKLISKKSVMSAVDESENVKRSILGLDQIKPNVTESVVDPIVENVELAKMLREVRQSLSSKARVSGDFSVDDIAGSIFNKNFSGRVRGLDGMEDLYSEYSEFKKMSDYAYKTFKPNRDQVNTSVRVLKNIGLGKATPDDVSGIKKIEDFLGQDVSGKSKSIGDKLKFEQATSKANIEGLKSDVQQGLLKLEKELANIRASGKTNKFALEQKVRDHKKVLEGLGTIEEAKKIGKGIVRVGIEGVVLYALFKRLHGGQ